MKCFLMFGCVPIFVRTNLSCFQACEVKHLMRAGERTGIVYHRKDRVVTILKVALFFSICAIVLLSLVPPVSKDALTHHLAVPKLYLQQGGIHELPNLPFSYFPMNLDLLYLVPLYFGNDIAPKLIHFSFALLTAWLIFGFLRHRIHISYVLFGVVFFLSIPIILRLSTIAYVDLGLVFFSNAALFWLIKWRENALQIRMLVVSAIFSGLAAGTKYNGLITMVLLTFFTLFFSAGEGRRKKCGVIRTLGYGFLYFAVAMVVFSPWTIRNYVWTGNPIYPLYDRWFNPDQIASNSIGLFFYRAHAYHESWWEIILLPLRIFFQGKDGNPQFFDGKLNPFLLVFSALAFYHLRKDSERLKGEKKIFLCFAILYFAFALFSSGLRIRYISPIIPPLVILSVFGIKRLFEGLDGLGSPNVKRAGKWLAASASILAISMNAFYIYRQFEYVKPFSYISGKVSRDEYIERYRPEYPAMKYINGHLPPDSTILFVFVGNRGYYCDRPYRFDMEKNKSLLAMLVKNSNGSKAAWEGLKRREITHALINLEIFKRWASESFSPVEITRVRSLLRGCLRLLYRKNGYGVFEIVAAVP